MNKEENMRLNDAGLMQQILLNSTFVEMNKTIEDMLPDLDQFQVIPSFHKDNITEMSKMFNKYDIKTMVYEITIGSEHIERFFIMKWNQDDKRLVEVDATPSLVDQINLLLQTNKIKKSDKILLKFANVPEGFKPNDIDKIEKFLKETNKILDIVNEPWLNNIKQLAKQTNSELVNIDQWKVGDYVVTTKKNGKIKMYPIHQK